MGGFSHVPAVFSVVSCHSCSVLVVDSQTNKPARRVCTHRTVWLLSTQRATLAERCCFWRNPTHDRPAGSPAAVQFSSITISSSANRLLARGTVTPCVACDARRPNKTREVPSRKSPMYQPLVP